MMTFKKSFYFILLLALLAAGIIFAGTAFAAPPSGSSHIIVFKDSVNVQRAVPEVAAAYGLQPGFTYKHALKGMSAVVPAGRLQALQRDPRVAYVVEDMERSINVQEMPTGIPRIFADSNGGIDIDGSDDFRVDVDVAVIDTGVDYEHYDLNVAGGVDCTGGGPFSAGSCVAGGDDNHYHGTHVAGTIAALDNDTGVVGVAPGARIWAVKVLNQRGSGWTSWIVAGIDWVAGNADTIEVANMSLGGGGFNQAEYDAIQGAVDAGVAFAVAAGNDSDDANNYSPAAFDNALTVSALADFDGLAGGLASPTCRSDEDDTLANFSNYGSAVDIAAPGVCILSTYPLEQGEYGTISGTSMASPHVAGALALLASSSNPGSAADVYALYDTVISSGNLNWTDESGDGIQEPLLDVNRAAFTPALIPGSGGVGGGSGASPEVIINSPTDMAYFNSGDSILFAGTASDAEDGDVTDDLIWFDDGNQLGTGGSFSEVLSEGTHTITAEVTDMDNNTASKTITVTVNPASSGDGINLYVTAYKVKGVQTADLTWNRTTSDSADIKRDGVIIKTVTPDPGEYMDSTGQKGGGTAVYQVCEAGTEICSNEFPVNW